MATTDYPNTAFVSGELDDAFGGKPANRYGVPQNTFRDGQIRELQRQAQDQWWSLRPVQYLPISSGGVAGDVIVFDSAAALGSGRPSFATLLSTGYTQDVTPIAGILLEPVSANENGRVCMGGGVIEPSVTGLSGSDAGEVTVDTTTGRLRAKATGETTIGYCDGYGNCYLLPVGTVL